MPDTKSKGMQWKTNTTGKLDITNGVLLINHMSTMPSDLSDLSMGSRLSFLTQWQAAGIRTSAMGGFCLFNMFQLHILIHFVIAFFLHGGMGANMYGTESCGAILFLKHSCSIMQHVLI